MPVTPSLSIGSKKKFITPEWIRGKPPTGVLVASRTAYHRIRQIANKISRTYHAEMQRHVLF